MRHRVEHSVSATKIRAVGLPMWRHTTLLGMSDEIRQRLEGLGLSPAREAEIVEELSQHLDDQYEQELSHGATEEAARETVLTELKQSDILAASLKRVAPGDPTNSYLYRKITGVGITGDRMPQGGPYLSDAQIALVRDWIRRGAPND